MPQLKTATHERFAQAIARGVNQTNAAKEAGYPEASAHVRASELMKRPDVKARVAELKAKAETLAVKRVALSREEVLNRLLDVADKAMSTGNLNAANRAWELIGKEMGMFVDRKMELKSPLDALNAQQLKALTDWLNGARAAPNGSPPAADGAAEPPVTH
ncbi:terminase small subunit [Azospirillum soli]|uniref:terminase small subunit n=1 Tax=Azospirillum soli TaxID=1304799 RepID=UPI001AE34838|nr:terminase small subunit [Azospirillum soli]MBP2311898.1 phage terminase small subunit [Azospirillum soli]